MRNSNGRDHRQARAYSGGPITATLAPVLFHGAAVEEPGGRLKTDVKPHGRSARNYCRQYAPGIAFLVPLLWRINEGRIVYAECTAMFPSVESQPP